jgi:hypothetical protein
MVLNNVSFSQENFLNGYIVKSNQDTLRGLADYRNRDKNPYKISFKKDSTSISEIFSPLDLIMFQVLDEQYVSGIVSAEKSPSKSNQLTINTAFAFVAEKQFWY